MTKSTQKALDIHIEDAKERFNEINDKIDLIRTNHLHHLDLDMKEAKVDLKWLKEGFKSLKGRLWWIAGLILGGGVLTDLFIK